MSTECPKCEETFSYVGNHWRYNDSHRPTLSQHQREIITGLLMGDGSLDSRSGNPILTVEMTNKQYLEQIDQKFGVLSTGVKHKCSAERAAERAKDSPSGFKVSGNPDNYNAKYRLRTRSLPELSEWDWYDSGSKVWPEDIELTPTVLKHWYAGDGSINNNGHRFYIELHCTNEADNKEKVESYFSDIDIEISRWRDDGEDSEHRRCAAIFNKQRSKQLLDYMGEPPSGFGYKWDR